MKQEKGNAKIIAILSSLAVAGAVFAGTQVNLAKKGYSTTTGVGIASSVFYGGSMGSSGSLSVNQILAITKRKLTKVFITTPTARAHSSYRKTTSKGEVLAQGNGSTIMHKGKVLGDDCGSDVVAMDDNCVTVIDDSLNEHIFAGGDTPSKLMAFVDSGYTGATNEITDPDGRYYDAGKGRVLNQFVDAAVAMEPCLDGRKKHYVRAQFKAINTCVRGNVKDCGAKRYPPASAAGIPSVSPEDFCDIADLIVATGDQAFSDAMKNEKHNNKCRKQCRRDPSNPTTCLYPGTGDLKTNALDLWELVASNGVVGYTFDTMGATLEPYSCDCGNTSGNGSDICHVCGGDETAVLWAPSQAGHPGPDTTKWFCESSNKK